MRLQCITGAASQSDAAIIQHPCTIHVFKVGSRQQGEGAISACLLPSLMPNWPISFEHKPHPIPPFPPLPPLTRSRFQLVPPDE